VAAACRGSGRTACSPRHVAVCASLRIARLSERSGPATPCDTRKRSQPNACRKAVVRRLATVMSFARAIAWSARFSAGDMRSSSFCVFAWRLRLSGQSRPTHPGSSTPRNESPRFRRGAVPNLPVLLAAGVAAAAWHEQRYGRRRGRGSSGSGHAVLWSASTAPVLWCDLWCEKRWQRCDSGRSEMSSAASNCV